MYIVEQFQFVDGKGCPHEGMNTVTRGGHSYPFTAYQRPSNVGGSRMWLRCQCGRTVARLYFYREWLRCRHCLRLGYKSQLVDTYTRQIWREDRLRKLLSCGARRPKGMHLKTFRRIKAMIEVARERQDQHYIKRVTGAMLKLLAKTSG